jgi:VWFA-related protein
VQLLSRPWRVLFLSAACWAFSVPALAQEPVQSPQNPSPQNPDVIKVNTTLVQTDVMVFDKQGGFVDGLKREQFVLKVDGKPREISFFDRIVAGSRNEEAQLAAARGAATGKAGAVPLDRGRTVFFFVDDLHMSLAGNTQTRALLRRFIDRDMGQNDEVAIASTSGQIGFLQQLTDDRLVLHKAIERITSRGYGYKDSQRPVMTEYQAQLIQQGNDDVLTFFVDELLRLYSGNPPIPRNMAAAEIQGRASQIAQQTDFLSSATLAALRNLVKSAAALPGRKVVFLVSDGFLLDRSKGDSFDKIRDVTAAAAATGVIIYAIDARGLTSGMPDASRETPFDPSGRLVRAAGGELAATQDALHALAVDTGGRAFLTSNDLSLGVKTALKETSAYYLLAWRPDNDDQRNAKTRRVEVTIEGRSDLSIRFHKGFGDSLAPETASQKKKAEVAATRMPSAILGEAMRSNYPKRDLPVAISLNFLDLPQLGPSLTTSIKVITNSMVLEAQNDQRVAALDLVGGVYDDQGKPVSSFNKHLTIRSKSNDPKTPPPDSLFYSHFCTIKPGLYQVRVAALDAKQHRVGSANGWIQIPDLTTRTLALSSLIVGEKRLDAETQPVSADSAESTGEPEAVRNVFLNIDHHFAGSSHLRFVTFVYNASASATAPTPLSSGQATSDPGNSVPAVSTTVSENGPDLAVQVQLFRDNQPIITMPLHKIQVDRISDAQRLPYAAEVHLEGLQAGRYMLLLTVIDRLAKTSASQRFGFQVD